MDREIQNARIERADLAIEDHGILVADIMFGFGSSSQGLGGLILEGPSKTPSKMCGLFIRRLMETLEVYKWAKIRGSYCRVRRNDKGMIDSIGHFLKDKWLVLEDLHGADARP